MIKHSLHRYKTQEMCDKAVDHFLSAVKFVPDLFVKSKLIRNLHNALQADDDIHKAFKKYMSKELMLIAQHPTRCGTEVVKMLFVNVGSKYFGGIEIFWDTRTLGTIQRSL